MSRRLKRNADNSDVQLLKEILSDNDALKSTSIKKSKRLIVQEINAKETKLNNSSTSTKKNEKDIIVHLKNGESIKLCSTCAKTNNNATTAKKVTEKKDTEIKNKDNKKPIVQTKPVAPKKSSTEKKKPVKAKIESSSVKSIASKKNEESITSKSVMTRSMKKKEDSIDEIDDEPHVLWDSILSSSVPKKASRQKKKYFTEINTEEEKETSNTSNKIGNIKENMGLGDTSKTKVVSKKKIATGETKKSTDEKPKGSTPLLSKNKKNTRIKSKENSKNSTI